MPIDSENKLVKLIDVIKSLSLPDWISENVLKALGKGVYGITIELTEIPINYLKNYNEKIKQQGKINSELIQKAAKEYSKIFESNIVIAERALTNFGISLFEKQKNREIIGVKALNQLQKQNFSNINEPKESISSDWLSSFWNLAENKTESDVREILSKILANEIIKPKSISLHTLQILSVLSSEIGHVFEKMCNLSIDDGEMAYFIHPNVYAFQNIGVLDEYDIKFNDLLKLDGAGLIRSTEAIKLNFGKNEFGVIDFAGIKGKLNLTDLQLALIYFTQAGRELRNLINLNPNQKYVNFIKDKLRDKLILEI